MLKHSVPLAQILNSSTNLLFKLRHLELTYTDLLLAFTNVLQSVSRTTRTTTTRTTTFKLLDRDARGENGGGRSRGTRRRLKQERKKSDMKIRDALQKKMRERKQLREMEFLFPTSSYLQLSIQLCLLKGKMSPVQCVSVFAWTNKSPSMAFTRDRERE